ncbi:MAG: hypothetical protein LBN21_00325 [Treponema sp.]|jgi:hypothetical protein|nr:hypothetical protein [Treponema sp.]
MTRGILIAGNESTLSAAIEAEAARRVEHFAYAPVPNRFASAGTFSAEGGIPKEGLARLPFSWNPGSPISARTLMIAAENRLEHIDEAILVCAPPPVRRPAADLSAADIEIMLNDQIKGWFFLVKELALAFRAKKSGTLALVFSDIGSGGGKDDAPDLLGAAAFASFRAFAQGLLSAAFNEPYLTLGFSSSSAGDEADFASFIFKILDEGSRKNNGKWHKYGKLNLFNR